MEENPGKPRPQDNEAIWHFGVDGRQEGPLTLEQARELATQKRIDLSSLAWRPGMSDWKKLGEIPELAELVKPFAVPKVSPSPSLSTGTDEGNEPSDASDLECASAPTGVTRPAGEFEAGGASDRPTALAHTSGCGHSVDGAPGGHYCGLSRNVWDT